MPFEGQGGFISGAPCSERNTAFLGPKGFWSAPRDGPQCVDITAMARRKNVPEHHQLAWTTTLYADHMRLKNLPEFVAQKMPNLSLIDLKGNRLRRMRKDIFAPFRRLRILLLEDNRIFIPKSAAVLESASLETLSLSNNKIRRLTGKTFAQLKGLIVLYLDGNWLKKLSPKVFKPLKLLKYLHLGNNRLKVLPDNALVPLKAVVIVRGNPFNTTEVTNR